MFWSIIALVFSALLDLFHLGHLTDQEKDLEIRILRHQLDIMKRKRIQYAGALFHPGNFPD